MAERCTICFLQPRKVSEKTSAGIPVDLGRGESDPIGLALDAGADLVILDDQRGGFVAHRKGLSVTDTIGVLIEAKQSAIKPNAAKYAA